MRARLFILFVMVLGLRVEAGIKDSTVVDEVYRYNLSAMVGFPILVGLNAEYVLPYVHNHWAVNASYSYIPNPVPSAETRVRYASIGVNGYFNQKGRGWYGGLEYGRLSAHADYIDNKEVNIDVGFNCLNAKLGVKAGKRLFFRFETGYSLYFFNIDEANEFLSKTYGIRVSPKLEYIHFPNLSLGLGFSF